MIIHSDKTSTLQYYDTFSSLANQQVHENNMDRWQETTSRHTTSESRSLGWYGVKDIPTLRGMLELYGWEEGAMIGQEKFGHIKAPSLPSIKRKRTRGTYGHTLDICAVYNGNLNKAWLTAKKERTNGRMKKTGNVNVVIDLGGSACVSADAFFWKGAVGVMLARSLQKSGRNVRILATASSRDYSYESGASKYLCTVINCKDYGAPITLDSLFGMTALSGFFRYYIFKAWCTQEFKLDSGFGMPRSIEDKDLTPIVDDNPCIIVSDIWTEKQANRTVATLLERFK